MNIQNQLRTEIELSLSEFAIEEYIELFGSELRACLYLRNKAIKRTYRIYCETSPSELYYHPPENGKSVRKESILEHYDRRKVLGKEERPIKAKNYYKYWLEFKQIDFKLMIDSKSPINPHIMLVERWLNNPSHVCQDELEANYKAAEQFKVINGRSQFNKDFNQTVASAAYTAALFGMYRGDEFKGCEEVAFETIVKLTRGHMKEFYKQSTIPRKEYLSYIKKADK